jgi:hypothetical protein
MVNPSTPPDIFFTESAFEAAQAAGSYNMHNSLDTMRSIVTALEVELPAPDVNLTNVVLTHAARDPRLQQMPSGAALIPKLVRWGEDPSKHQQLEIPMHPRDTFRYTKQEVADNAPMLEVPLTGFTGERDIDFARGVLLSVGRTMNDGQLQGLVKTARTSSASISFSQRPKPMADGGQLARIH